MNVCKLLLAVAVMFPTTLLARQWTDDTGQFRREAEYLRHDARNVWVRDDSGRTFVVALERLSQVDRQYVAALRVGREPSDIAQDTRVSTAAPIVRGQNLGVQGGRHGREKASRS